MTLATALMRKKRSQEPAPSPVRLSIRARELLAGGMKASGMRDLLTDEERDELVRIATVVDLRKRHLAVFSQGAQADALFIVGSGAIRVCRYLEDGTRQALSFLYPGDLLGLAEEGRYVNSAETLTASRLFRISYAALRELVKHDTSMECVLLVKLAHELRETQRHVITMGRPHVASRLALLLGDLCLDTPYYNAKTRQLRLLISRSDIGDYLGAAPDVITRAFAALEREGVACRSTSKTISIPDLTRLLRYGRARS